MPPQFGGSLVQCWHRHRVRQPQQLIEVPECSPLGAGPAIGRALSKQSSGGSIRFTVYDQRDQLSLTLIQLEFPLECLLFVILFLGQVNLLYAAIYQAQEQRYPGGSWHTSLLLGEDS